MKRITVESLLSIPLEDAAETIVGFLKSYFAGAGAEKAVVGLSGGLDSSVTLRLLVDALGANKVTAAIMPDTRVTPPEDTRDAAELAGSLGVEYFIIPIDTVVDSYSVIPGFDAGNRLATGNLRARIRMNILYYIANRLNGIVVGTGDRSELLLGYFTKYGDGGVDVLPLACLYKTQVRELGRRLGLPARILGKPSSPRLWKGHLAEEEIGLSYEAVDLVFYSLIDLGLSISEAVDATGLPVEVFERVLSLHRRSRHKRRLPPFPSLPWLQEPVKEI
ncbi:NAD+ synthase [Desulfurococcus mucosus]|uniref:NH(3)-dependent NAD(+) synthetase n=1 Tax=Desulfurococcus mucosus (strain ATCC 35584 / DSM 2162 / JCM 9187 / O7/1) TaxID=765177 RepID=E8R7J8_DESM0|nr:NAD+ synthase [Desulfurococcus mucosus]ADV64493.1 NH(3)-dependent NAD(+) synthetase [Desulfurococcus mucosus DSM 2162]